MLTRLQLRRDWVVLCAWLLLSWGVSGGRAPAYDSLYPTAQALQDRYDQVMVGVPMYKLYQGPAYGSDLHALLAQESLGAATLLGGLGAAIFAVRYTRGDEQTGRRELLGSAPIGRHAPIASALAVTFMVGLLLAVLTTVTLLVTAAPLTGSLIFGLATGSGVWICASMAVVAAQLTASPRAAVIATIGAFYLLHFVRGVSDFAGPGLTWLGWLTPNGWLQRTQAFAANHWWPFLLVAVVIVVLVWTAVTLSEGRDLGSGLLAARRGVTTASPRLRGPFALAWRLHRTMVLTWFVGVVFICVPTALVGTAGMEQFAGSPQMAEWAAAMGSDNPADALFTYIAYSTVFPITWYAISIVLWIRSEETDGRAVLLLATPISRPYWATGHLTIAVAVPPVLLATVGLCFGLGSGDPSTMMRTTTSLVPAVWVLVGIAMAACGLTRRWAHVVGYGALTVAVAVEFGMHLGWPTWVFTAFSPLAHVLPFYGIPSATTLFVLTLIAAGLCAVGMAALRRRDLLV